MYPRNFYVHAMNATYENVVITLIFLNLPLFRHYNLLSSLLLRNCF